MNWQDKKKKFLTKKVTGFSRGKKWKFIDEK